MPDLSAHFHPVVPVASLRSRPRRAFVGGIAYVLWRDADGAPHALVDRCPHRHAPLSRGSVRPDGRLACRAHGWHFNGAGEGRSPAVPNLRPCLATSCHIAEHHGWLWIAGTHTSCDVLPLLGADDWSFIGSYALRAEAPLHVVLDNFSEHEHTPFVHGRLGRREGDTARITVDARCLPDRTEVTFTATQRASALLPLLLVKRGDTLVGESVTRFSPVHSIYTLSWRSPEGRRRPFSLRAAVCFVPETDRRTNIVSFLFSRLDGRRLLPRRVRDTLALALGWKDIRDDARWLRHLATTPPGFEGMKLTPFDEPLAHNRALTESLYYAKAIAEPRVLAAADDTLVQLRA